MVSFQNWNEQKNNWYSFSFFCFECWSKFGALDKFSIYQKDRYKSYANIIHFWFEITLNYYKINLLKVILKFITSQKSTIVYTSLKIILSEQIL